MEQTLSCRRRDPLIVAAIFALLGAASTYCFGWPSAVLAAVFIVREMLYAARPVALISTPDTIVLRLPYRTRSRHWGEVGEAVAAGDQVVVPNFGRLPDAGVFGLEDPRVLAESVNRWRANALA